MSDQPGISIPKRLHYPLEVFRKHIQTIDRLNPVKGAAIAEGMSTWCKVNITEPDVRTMVSYLRAAEWMPIGSDNNGYFFARERFELKTTKQHLQGRINQMKAVLDGLEKSIRGDTQGSIF